MKTIPPITVGEYTVVKDDFVKATSAAYQAKTGNTPAVYVCRATDGAAVV